MASASQSFAASSQPDLSQQQPLLRSAVDAPMQQTPFQVKLHPSYPTNHATPLQQKPKMSRTPAQTGKSTSVSQPQSPPIQVKRVVPAQQQAVQPQTIQAMQPTSSAPSAQKSPSTYSFQSSQQRPPVKTQTVPLHAMDVKQKWDEMEQDFRAEFEKSAELLLRPYIAQWLDEHFHHLFEKILREEIQRLVQNLHR